MHGFSKDFDLYIGKIVNRCNLKENEQVIFQRFVRDEEIITNMLCSKADLMAES